MDPKTNRLSLVLRQMSAIHIDERWWAKLYIQLTYCFKSGPSIRGMLYHPTLTINDALLRVIANSLPVYITSISTINEPDIDLR